MYSKTILYSIPYLFFFFFICILLFVNENTKTKTNHIAKFQIQISVKTLFILSFILFMGFRGYLAYDWLVYEPIYLGTPSLLASNNTFKDVLNFFSANVGFENGFRVLLIILKSFSSDYLIFQFYLFLIDFIILYYFFKYYLKEKWMWGFIFYFSFGGFFLSTIYLRNIKAILLFLISIPYLENKKYIKYVLLNIIGMSFHSSAIIYIIVLPLLKISFSRKFLFIFLIMGIIIKISGITVIRPVINFFDFLFPMKIKIKLNNYLISSKFYGIRLGDLERIGTFLILLYYRKIIGYKENKVFFNSFYLYIFIYLYCSDLTIVVGRVSQLFIFSYWILYPKLFEKIKIKYNKLFILTFVLLYCFFKIGKGTIYNAFYYDNYFSINQKTRTDRYEMFKKFGNTFPQEI